MGKGGKLFTNRMTLHSVQGVGLTAQFSSRVLLDRRLMNRMRNNLAFPFNVPAYSLRLRCGHMRGDEGIGIGDKF